MCRFLVLFFCLSSQLPAAVYQHRYDFTKLSDTVGWAGDWYEVPGYPKVAAVQARILIPYGEHFVSATAKSSVIEEVDSGLHRELVLFPRTICKSRVVSGPAWDRKTNFPEHSVGEAVVHLKHGFEFVTIPLFAEQFDPIKNQTVIFRETTLEIVTEQNRYDESYRGLLDDMVDVAPLVDNPDVLITYPERDRDRGVQYLVIGPKSILEDADPNGLSALLNEKESRGISTGKLTLETINSTVSGADQQERVRNAIREKYKSDGTKYVLLVGNGYSILPTRRLVVSVADEKVPSDFYFACLDGDFSSASNSDLACEVYVGRAPVSSVAEMKVFVAKTLKRQSIDSLDPVIANNLLFGEKLDSQTLGGPMMEQIAMGGKAGDLVTMGYPDVAKHSRFYETFSTSFNASQVIDGLNKGNFYTVNHMGHANEDYCMRFNSSYISQLTNEVPFFGITQGCHPGDLDVPNWASKLVLHPKGGAAAMIANSGYGWYDSNGSSDGPSQRFHLAFYDTLFRERKQSVGWVHYRAKERLISQVQASPYIRSVVYETNLLGDPELKFKYTMPLN